MLGWLCPACAGTGPREGRERRRVVLSRTPACSINTLHAAAVFNRALLQAQVKKRNPLTYLFSWVYFHPLSELLINNKKHGQASYTRHFPNIHKSSIVTKEEKGHPEQRSPSFRNTLDSKGVSPSSAEQLPAGVAPVPDVRTHSFLPDPGPPQSSPFIHSKFRLGQ